MRLSVIILTYNEEHNLPDCLESLKGLESELFVVDSGSTDRTREIAEQYGAKVFQHSFENYAAQRNWTQQNLPIRGEWLLHLDADERLTPELVTEIQETLNETSREHGARSREQSEAGAARLRTSNEQGAGSREPEEARGQRLEVGGERTANGEWQIAESREHGAGSQRGRRTD
ncbi:MAG: glycosyltransferase family 2 protein, partial [Deltaproteobacteria bacterium]|nr:glycosyltransferase family 2 protein [Deltaproteobacteria bacterium]